MKEGRPFGTGKLYNDELSEENVDTLSKTTNVGGWAGYVGPF